VCVCVCVYVDGGCVPEGSQWVCQVSSTLLKQIWELVHVPGMGIEHSLS